MTRHTPPVTTARDPSSTTAAEHSSLLIVFAAASAGVQLARDASGELLLPALLAAALQIPLIALWIHRAFRRRDMVDLILSAGLTVASVGIGLAHQSVDTAGTAPTLFVVACVAASWLAIAYRFAESNLNNPQRLLRASLPVWIGVGLMATLVLSLPVATRSSVPDYRHNLLLHVANNGFAAASAACLTGWTSYGFGDDYSRVGQAVLWVLTQFSGCLFAAVGLAIMRPFLRSAMTLRGLLMWAFALQGLVIAIAFPYWQASDAATPGVRAWWGAVHGADAMWNTGLILRPNGLAPYLLSGPIYALITLVALAGSLGLPVIYDLMRGTPTTSNSKTPEQKSVAAPWLALPAWEAGAAFWFLVAGAIILAVCESPGYMPDALTFKRPFQFGSQQMSLRDDIGLPARASLAIHVSAMLRSAGIQSTALAEGGITIPSYILMLVWMMVGGSIAGTAGGLRVSTLALLAVYLFSNRAAWDAQIGAPPNRASLARSLVLFLIFWLILTTGAVVILGLLTEASTYQIVFDAVAALNNVGFTTGLIVHPSWTARLFLIATMIAGRLIPLFFWARLSDRIQAGTAS